VVTGGKRTAESDSFFEPTVLTDVTTDIVTTKKETFGSVAPLYRFKSGGRGHQDGQRHPNPPRSRGRAGRGGIDRWKHRMKRAGQGRRIWMVRRNAVERSYSRQIVASVHPSSSNSAERSGASAAEKNSSSCGGGTAVLLSIAWAWPR
jgi:hypothetical protein